VRAVVEPGKKEIVMETQMNDATGSKLRPFLTLLLMVCRRKPRRRHPRRREPALPRGCVFVVRCSSR